MSMHFAVMTKTTLWSFLPQVQSADFVCSECGKKYKTRGGYQRHRASKHNPNENDRQERTTLTPSSLAEIVKYAIQTVNRGRAFAPSLRNELNLYQFKQFDEGTDEFTVLKTIYDGYLKNGDIEKFYGKYYGQVTLQSTKFFSGLSHNAATLLATKVADSMLVYCKSTKACCSSNHPTQTLLSEREKAGLQYVGGYVPSTNYGEKSQLPKPLDFFLQKLSLDLRISFWSSLPIWSLQRATAR